MSGSKSTHSRLRSASVSTRRTTNSMPLRWSSRSVISASDGTSSTITILSTIVMDGSLPSRPRRRARQAVDQHPVASRLGDLVDKARKIDRLDDVAVYAKRIAGDDVALLGTRCQHHHRDRPGRLVRLDLAQYLDAVDFGHLEIEQHELRRPFGPLRICA